MYPDNDPEVVREVSDSLYMYTCGVTTGIISGYQIQEQPTGVNAISHYLPIIAQQ